MYDQCYLREDEIEEILVRLPVKTLIRFKLVSKTWLDTITSRSFTARQCYYSLVACGGRPSSAEAGNPENLLVLRILVHPYPVSKFERIITSISLTTRSDDVVECRILEYKMHVPYLDVHKMKELLISCNTPSLVAAGLGLYCIFKFRTKQEVAALWNPVTREIKVLPPPPFSDHDLKYPNCMVGFGHAAFNTIKSFSYKVGIAISNDRQENWPYFNLYLYASSTSSWKLLTCNFGYQKLGYKDAVNLNGTLHLLSVSPPSENIVAYIVTFDYASETFGRMELPELPQIRGRTYTLQQSRLSLYDKKFLCLLVYGTQRGEITDDYYRPSELFFDVWVMYRYGLGDSWKKLCTIGPVKHHKEVLSYSKSLGGLLLADCFNNGTKLCFCNSTSAAVTNLPFGTKYDEHVFVSEHIQSLITIDGAT